MVVDDSLYIHTEIAGSVVRVDVDPLLYQGAPPAACWPLSEQGDPSLALTGPSEGTGPEDFSRRENPAAGSGEQSLPLRTEVGAPFPNPGRGGFSISLAVSPERSGPFEVTVYDVLGRRVTTILDREVKVGRHLLEWDGQNGEGRRGLGCTF
jgi:hypothetical protein